MSYRMWKGNKSKDFANIDRMIGEQYRIGGVDAWLYTYEGVKQTGSTDLTKPNTNTGGNSLSTIGDLVFGETVNRKYNVEAITLPVVYSVQDATPDLKAVAIFFHYETMDISLHYNTMMQYVGRKIIPGDVLELPNLRDEDVYGNDSGVNRFYVVQDAFRSSIGYSATWLNHIYKLRVKPLTDSPEFDDLLKDNDYKDNPDDPNNGNGNNTPNSTYDKEINIMNTILQQAEDEVPYIHWDNEHIFRDCNSTEEALFSTLMSGYTFPVPHNGMRFIKKTEPVLYEKTSSGWDKIDVQIGTELPKPRNSVDSEFYFIESASEKTGYSLYQYYADEGKWVLCDIKFYTDVPDTNDDFYVHYKLPTIYQYMEDYENQDNSKWEVMEFSTVINPFNTSDIRGNITNPQDWRSSIPPARGDVEEGTQFPNNVKDGDYFYRTDFVPVTLWQYNKEQNKWFQFNYGGRLPWVGANYERVKYINSPDRVSIKDVVKPNTAYRRYNK